jgi:hypothetical protein
MVGSSENGNEHSGSTKGGTFFNYMSGYQLLKKGSPREFVLLHGLIF